jgi:phosphatidate cytidylyltransferase
MLKKRIISTVILIGLAYIGLIFDWLSALIVTALIILGLYEFFTMLENKGIRIYKYFGIAMGSIIPLSIMLRFEMTKGWEFSFVVIGLLFLIMMQFKRRQNSGAIVDISTTIFGIIYVSWSLSFLIKIRYLQNGFGLLILIIMITKLGDIGAYLIGGRFGKIPLMPRISPKKSVEGAIGGLLFSVLGSLACKELVGFSFIHLLVVGLSLGILAQLGDLSESMMKRDCQVKDSSNIIPGIGGVLDLTDSLLFTAPVFYFYIIYVVLRQ